MVHSFSFFFSFFFFLTKYPSFFKEGLPLVYQTERALVLGLF